MLPLQRCSLLKKCFGYTNCVDIIYWLNKLTCKQLVGNAKNNT